MKLDIFNVSAFAINLFFVFFNVLHESSLLAAISGIGLGWASCSIFYNYLIRNFMK